MIKSIWENNIMPVSRKIKIVIPRLKMSRKNTMPRRLTTCGMVRLSLSLSLNLCFHNIFPCFPIFIGRAGRYQSFHTVSPDFFGIAVPELQQQPRFFYLYRKRLSRIRSTLSLPLLCESGSMIFVPKSREAVLMSELKSLIFWI